MIFNEQKPLSQYDKPPSYVMNPKQQFLLKMLGYSPSGEQTAWGKALGWVPGIGLGTNALAQNVTREAGAKDANFNVKQSFDNDINKLKTEAGVAEGVLGGVTGDPAMIGAGIKTTTAGAGSLLADQNQYQTQGQQFYYGGGGKMDNGGRHGKRTGIVLIDKLTGDYIGEMEKDERIFSVDDTKKMEEAHKSGDTKKLGEVTSAALDRQADNDGNTYGDGGKPKNGEEITIDGKKYQYRGDGWYEVVNGEDKITLRQLTADESKPVDEYYQKNQASASNVSDRVKPGTTAKVDGMEYVYRTDGRWEAANFEDKGMFATDDRAKKLNEIALNPETKAFVDKNAELRDRGDKAAANTDVAEKLGEVVSGLSPDKQTREDGRTSNTVDAPDAATDTRKETTADPNTAKTTDASAAKHEQILRTADHAIDQAKADDSAMAHQSTFGLTTDADVFADPNAKPKASLGDYLGFGEDILNAGLGLFAAGQKLPEYKVPQDWTNYVSGLKQRSDQGLTAAERGEYMRNLDSTYALDVANVEGLSGGSAGIALGNLGRAAYNRNLGTGQMEIADANLKQQNMKNYGSALGINLDLSRQIFGDKYNYAAQNKMAGAQLAADALSNIQGRSDYNKFYGKNSSYQQLQDEYVKQQKYLTDIMQSQKEAGRDYMMNMQNQTTTPPTLPNTNSPIYWNGYIQDVSKQLGF